MEMQRKRLAASGGKGIAMAAPGGIALVLAYRIWPEQLGSLTITEQNGIAVGMIAGVGYVLAVLKTWATDMLPGHPNNLLYRLLAGGSS